MKGKKHFNNIFFRVYAAFAFIILLFAIVLGLIFIRLYRNTNSESNREQLTKVATTISDKFRNYIIDSNYDEALEYLNTIIPIESAEIWTVSNPQARHPMDERLVCMNVDPANLQSEFTEMISQAFTGFTNSQSFYSEVHGTTILVVSEPIKGAGGNVCGAVLAIMNMEQMEETISDVQSMIFMSAIVALVISVALVTAFVKRITDPIHQMQAMTREMMEGNYKVKTGIDRTDEIGEMARSIDMLSDKLLENEEIRRNMDQMRLDFFANVSHELRTPIAVVRAYTESLIDGVVTEEDKVRQYYERVLDECKTMQRLVGDLLTLSKMQNPDFVIEKEPVNLVHVFDDIVRSASAISAEKNIRIDMERDRDIYMMMGDYDRLRQMFMVIFDNAVKFSPENSTIHVGMKSEDGRTLEVSIRDEGVGISPEELPQIFDKFYKSKLRQNAKGTGLGLAIAKYIAIKHDGEIHVSSTVGVGTTFTFTFHEAHEDDAEVTGITEYARHTGGSRGRK